MYTACQNDPRWFHSGCFSAFAPFPLRRRGECRSLPRGSPLQSRHPPHHLRDLLPLPRPRQELAHGRHAPRSPRRGPQAHRRRHHSHRPRRSGEERHHPAHFRRQRPRDAAGLHPQGADSRAEGDHAPMGEGRRALRGPLGLSAHRASRGPHRRRQSHRRLHSGPPVPRRPEAVPRGRSPHPAAPRDARPHRPAPHSRRSRRVPQRHLAECLRQRGRSPAGLAALCRAAGHALAGRRALCRHLRLPRRQRLPRVALPRLRPARLPRQQALR